MLKVTHLVLCRIGMMKMEILTFALGLGLNAWKNCGLLLEKKFCCMKDAPATHSMATRQLCLASAEGRSSKSELTCVIVEFLKVVSLQEFASILEPNLCKIVSSLRLYLRLPLIAGLAKLEHWCNETTEEYTGSAWDELEHIRQAIGFLVSFKSYAIPFLSTS
ncbi:myosin-13-like, partial [Rosa sericea]